MAMFWFVSVGPEGQVARQEFRWARCRRALPQSRLRALGVPLPRDELEDVVTGLRWEDIKARPGLALRPHVQPRVLCFGKLLSCKRPASYGI